MSEDDRAQQYFEDTYYKMFGCTPEHDYERDKRVYRSRVEEVGTSIDFWKGESND